MVYAKPRVCRHACSLSLFLFPLSLFLFPLSLFLFPLSLSLVLPLYFPEKVARPM